MTTEQIITRAKRRNITVPQLLAKAGINRSTWYRWTRGKYSPRMESLRKIQDVLKGGEP